MAPFIAGLARWILLCTLRALNSLAVVTIIGIDKRSSFSSLIDTMESVSMAMRAGHTNGVAITPSFLDETVVAFGLVRQITSIRFVHPWDIWLDPFVV
jgi:hypothetical protein